MLGESYIEDLYLLANRIVTGNLASREYVMTYKLMFFLSYRTQGHKSFPSELLGNIPMCSDSLIAEAF